MAENARQGAPAQPTVPDKSVPEKSVPEKTVSHRREGAVPARPPMSDRTPAPVRFTVAPTLTINVARSLWTASFAAGVAAVVFAFIWRDSQIEEVKSMIVDLQPNSAEETQDAVTFAVFLASALSIVLVALLEFAFVQRMMSRRGWVRWVLMPVLVLHVGSALLAESFLTFGNEGIFIAALVVTQLVLAVAALVVSFLPGARRWFRVQPDARSDHIVGSQV